MRSFQEYIEDHKDEITALQVLYERPYRQRLSYSDIKALADALVSPPRSWTTERLWEAYRQLDELEGCALRDNGLWPTLCPSCATP